MAASWEKAGSGQPSVQFRVSKLLPASSNTAEHITRLLAIRIAQNRES